MSDVTQILERIESGDPAAVNWPAASNVKLSVRTSVLPSYHFSLVLR